MTARTTASHDADGGDENRSPHDAFTDLVERSSLGTPGAKSLRQRTSTERAKLTRNLARLRNDLAHRDLDDSSALAELVILADQCDRLGLHDEALRGYLQAAARLVEKVALNLEQRGNTQQANIWRARATTFDQ